MRGVLVLLLLWPQLAAADDPSGLLLEESPVELVRGLQLRLIKGTTVDRNRATFDWGTARLYMTVYSSEVDADAGFKKAIIDDLSKQAPRIARARVDPLALAKPLVGYAVIPRAPAREDELVYAAYIARADSTVYVLGFYVDLGGVANQAGWIEVAKRIVATATTSP